MYYTCDDKTTDIPYGGFMEVEIFYRSPLKFLLQGALKLQAVNFEKEFFCR